MRIKSSVITIICAIAAIIGTSCSKGSSAAEIEKAAAVADSVLSADGNASAAVNAEATGIDVTVRVDSLIDVTAVGQELFDIYASAWLKTVPAAKLDQVAKALRESKGSVTVKLVNPDSRSQQFTYTPKRIIDLQRARLTQLDPSIAKSQVIKVAEAMVPNPKANEGADSISASIAMSFLEYTIEWPTAKNYADRGQGVLTTLYFNPLKQQLIDLGPSAQPIVEMLTSLGIDGIRMVYTAKDSDKVIKQAFPWRELEKPIEETSTRK